MKIDIILKSILTSACISPLTVSAAVGDEGYLRLDQHAAFGDTLRASIPGLVALGVSYDDAGLRLADMDVNTDNRFNILGVTRKNPQEGETAELYAVHLAYNLLRNETMNTLKFAKANPGQRQVVACTSIDATENCIFDVQGFYAALDAGDYETAVDMLDCEGSMRDAFLASLKRVRPEIRDGRLKINTNAGLADFANDNDMLTNACRGKTVGEIADVPEYMANLVVSGVNDSGMLEVFINYEPTDIDDTQLAA